jgi:hypothetical protein
VAIKPEQEGRVKMMMMMMMMDWLFSFCSPQISFIISGGHGIMLIMHHDMKK